MLYISIIYFYRNTEVSCWFLEAQSVQIRDHKRASFYHILSTLKFWHRNTNVVKHVFNIARSSRLLIFESHNNHVKWINLLLIIAQETAETQTSLRHMCHINMSCSCCADVMLGGVGVGAWLHLYHYILVRHTLLPFLSYTIVLCSPAIRSSGEQFGIS